MEELQGQLDLSRAEAALERGDYGHCLALLEPLAEKHPHTSSEGGRVRLIMITAWMGQGDDQSALASCRLLCRSRDPELRQQAKQLLAVLESPSLARPERWSMRLPDLEMTATSASGPAPRGRRRSRKPPPPPPPPTGPTRPPAIGFALFAAAVLFGITLLLSGCVRIDADLDLAGPGHLQMQWDIRNHSGRLQPWQERFEQELHKQLPDLLISHPDPGALRISSRVISATGLQSDLDRMVELAAETTGLALNAPTIQLRERNWLIGVDQDLRLALDLSGLPDIPGLEITLNLNDMPSPALLHSGEHAILEERRWHWIPLGLGSLAVLLLLLLSLGLQSRRRLLGFGFPELPS